MKRFTLLAGKLVILTFLLSLLAPSAWGWEMKDRADTTTDYGVPDSIIFESPFPIWKADTTDNYYYDLRIYSDDSLAAFSIGATFTTHFLQIDSVIFSDQIQSMSGDPVLFSRIDNDSVSGSISYCGVLLGVIDMVGNPLDGQHIIELDVARVWVSVNDDSTYTVRDSMVICVDTMFVPPAGHLEFVTSRVPTTNWIPKSVNPVCVIVLPLTGDFDMNGIVEISDAVAMIAYIFQSGDPCDPYWIGDVDCSTVVEVSDVVYLVAFIFQGGPPPCT